MRSSICVACALSMLLAAPALAQEPEPRVPHITVPAHAIVEAAPDIAVLRLGILTERKSAAEAAAENARQAQAVIAELSGNGIEPRDIRTIGVTLTPNYDEERDPNGRTTRRVLRGYSARNRLEVRVRDLGRAGALAQKLIDRGANLFEGIGFEVSARDRLIEEARLTALGDAQARARRYVEVLGLKLGRVLRIDPDTDPDRGPAPMAGMRMAAAPEAGSPAMPVEPGVQTLTARVSVTFELLQP